MAARIGNLLRYFFLLRYQVVAAAFLVSLPLVALRTVARALLANLFVLEPAEALCVGALAVSLAWVVMITTQLTFRLAGGLGASRAVVPGWIEAAIRAVRAYRVPAFALLAAPVVFAVVRRSASITVTVAALAGVGVAWGVFLTASLTYYALLDPSARSSGLLLHLPFFERVHRTRLLPPVPNLLRSRRPRVTPGHLLCLVLFLGSLSFYAGIGWFFRPAGAHPDAFPALGYALLLATLGTWLLAGAAFWLDHYRVPTLLALLALSFAGSLLATVDHYYKVIPMATRLDCNSPSLPPSRALQAWFELLPGEERPKMVVVAASGVGLEASAWTARVLTGLEEEIGAPFNRSLAMISSVSGASVGALYYLDRFSRAASRGASSREAVRAAAAASSLRQVAWGMAYPDLWRLLFAPVVDPYRRLDRASATELAWRARLEQPHATLRRWRSEIAEGRLPVPIFSASAVETGKLMLLSPVDLGRQRSFDPFVNFQCLYPARDLELVTAARLSASFPFVSPLARPSDEVAGSYGRTLAHPDLHLADGGYHDNFGVTALVAWLNAVLPTYQELGGSDVLLLEIRGYESHPGKQISPRPAPERSWLYSIGGPLATLLNVRTASQSAHKQEELRLLRTVWEARGIRFTSVTFALQEGGGPLFWQLSAEEAGRIELAWEHKLKGREVDAVRGFFGGSN